MQSSFQLVAPRLGSLDVPMLVVWGTEDQIIPAKHAQHAPEQAEVRLLDGSRHSPHMEKSGEVNRIVEEFLAGLRAGQWTGGTMLIPKTMVVEQLRARGDTQGAERADSVLGEKVDTEQDAGLLVDLREDRCRSAMGASDW